MAKGIMYIDGQRVPFDGEKNVLSVIRKALVNIRDYHSRQRQNSWFDSQESGIILGQKVTPLARVGVYVPGGKAVYPSSVLMNVMPAKVAGVDEIIMVTPPAKNGKPNPEVFLKGAEALGLPPEQCLVFEDSAAGIEAAHRGGMKAIGIGTARLLPSAELTIPGFSGVMPDALLAQLL